jgi:hypothetical protein
MKKSFIIVLLTLLGNESMAQEKSTLINGKVISFEESFPIEGASVAVKGSKNYTGTQVDGTFSLELKPTDTTIVIRCEGFGTQEVKVNVNRRDYNIVLRRSGNFYAPGEPALIRTKFSSEFQR